MSSSIDSAVSAAQLVNYAQPRQDIPLDQQGTQQTVLAKPAEDTVSIQDSLLRSANLDLDVNADQQPPAEESTTNTNLEYRRREATVLKIRTREGDVVKLKFRNVEKTSIEASEQIDGEKTVSELEISNSRRTRLRISVKGDINDAELAAIQTVAEQAAKLAGAFFDGNIDAAFRAASEFAVDGSELARVSLRLSIRERLNYAQTTVTNAPVTVPPPADAPDEGATQSAQVQSVVPKIVSTSSQSTAPAATRTDVPLPATPTTTSNPTSEEPAPPADTDEPTQPTNLLDAFQALADMLNRIAEFLESLLGELTAPEEPSTEPVVETSRTVFDFRFRLDFFAAVVKTTIEDSAVEAPNDADNDSGETANVELLTDTLAAVAQDVDPQSVSEVA